MLDKKYIHSKLSYSDYEHQLDIFEEDFLYLYDINKEKYYDVNYNIVENENARFYKFTDIDFDKIVNKNDLEFHFIETSEFVWYAYNIRKQDDVLIYGLSNITNLPDFVSELKTKISDEFNSAYNLTCDIQIDEIKIYTSFPIEYKLTLSYTNLTPIVIFVKPFSKQINLS